MAAPISPGTGTGTGTGTDGHDHDAHAHGTDGHDHDAHAHPHPHRRRSTPHAGEPGALAPAAASASVAIDIGPGRGALVLYPGERFRGREIEISRLGEHGRRVHTGVHERTTQTTVLLTAIFGSLPEGEYVVWEDAVTEGPVVTVAGGAVAELRLSC
jgi:hypothetical protein